jgi:NACHT domain
VRRRPTGANLVAAFVLLLLPWAWLLRHHHLDGGTVGVILSVSLGLPALWLAAVGYLAAGRSAQASELTMAQVADQLAAGVRAQWEAEASMRGLNRPYPLPVSWAVADPDLAVEWGSLVNLASSGAGRRVPPAEAWAAGPADLAGNGDELVDVLDRVPTGRMVVLGEPGAGKTMLMIRLVLDLIGHRSDGEPVPILVSMASWDPVGQDLREWLAAQLGRDHPALSGPPPPGRMERTQAEALLADYLILPVLDGLDEIPEQIRGPAIGKINDALRPGERLVVTCRSEQYRDAIRPEGGRELRPVEAAAAIELCPLDLAAAREYLSYGAPGPEARARWDRLFHRLGRKAPVREAFTTPLMVSLANTVYNSSPAGSSTARPDPFELRNRALTDRKAVESVLFDAFIPAVYRRDLGGRWTAQDARKWLVFLARHLEREIASPDLAWWQLRRSVPRTAAEAVGVVAAVVGVAAGVLAGFAMAAFVVVARARVPVAVVVGLMVGAGVLAGVAGLAGRSSAGPPARGVRISGPGGMPVGALVAGWVIVIGVAAALGGGSVAAVVLDLVIVAAFAAGVMAVAGLEGVPGDLAEAASPRAVLARDRRMALLFTLAAGSGAGFVVGVLAGSVAGPGAGVAIGVLAGAGVGLGVSARQTAWPSYLLTVGWLAFSRELPWPLMGFLADAHRRGVLRQAGAVYQFRHIELQHRLANRDADERQANSPAAAAAGAMDSGKPGRVPPGV